MNLCGFDTIGNATVIVYDGGPVLATDPWIEGPAYFGSWGLSHEIPAAQRKAILDARFLWFSHGHPDHLNPDCVPLFKGKKILVPDHRGGRIAKDLRAQGFDVEVLPDGKWRALSPRVRILCSTDMNQDAMLFIAVNDRLVINANDSADFGRDYLARKLRKRFHHSILLSISGHPGESDFCHYFDEKNAFLAPPKPASLEPIGVEIARKCRRFDARYYIPTSSFHRFRRTDVQWILDYCSNTEDFYRGFSSTESEMLPSFLRYDCESDRYEKINPRVVPPDLVKPEECGDRWDEPLGPGDAEAIEAYFRKFEHLRKTLDVLRFRVGGKTTEVRLGNVTGKSTGLGLEFEAPRASLMTSVKYEIFDDLLIGNFVKCRLLGAWPDTRLYPDFIPYVTKYGDNGRAYTEPELAAYFADYRRRSRFGWWSIVEQELAPFLVRQLPQRSPLRAIAKRAYNTLRRHAGA